MADGDYWSLSARYHWRRVTTWCITHPVIGDLQKVGPLRLDEYDYVTTDGTMYRVEAEEDPGHCWHPGITIKDWARDGRAR